MFRKFLIDSRKNILFPLKRYCTNARNFEEIVMPVPWGQISGKWWGSQEKRPIVAIHGYQDNCGTFDRLFPELSTSYSFLAFDSPGHGLSSPLPKGMFYNFLNGPILLHLILKYFKWRKLSLLGHSQGGATCFTYTTYFPDNVDLLICLDGVVPLILPNDADNTANLIQKFVKYMDHDGLNKRPCYSLDEITKKYHEGSNKSINIENCKHILKRCIAPSKHNPEMFYFTNDPRIKAGPHFLGIPERFKNYAMIINCPIFICIPDTSPYYANVDGYKEIIDVLRSKNSAEFHFITGSHHIHLNVPEKLLLPLKLFLDKYYKTDIESICDLKNE